MLANIGANGAPPEHTDLGRRANMILTGHYQKQRFFDFNLSMNTMLNLEKTRKEKLVTEFQT